MLERSEFILSRAAVTVAIASCVFLAFSLGWWWRTEHRTLPAVYYDYSAWKRVNHILAFVQPVDTFEVSDNTKSTCSLGDIDYDAFELALKRFQEQLTNAQHQRFLQKHYALNTTGLLLSAEFSSLSCRDILPALKWLNRTGGGDNILKTLNWKERLPLATQSRLLPQQWVSVSQQSWTLRSPWAGLPGCVFWTNSNSGQKVANQGSSQQDLFCQTRAQERLLLPSLPGQALLLSRLAPLRIPQHPLFERLVGDSNLIQLRGIEQVMGLNIQLTLDPRWQELGQHLTDCYSGRINSPECIGQAIDQNYYEKARVRLAGISVIDVGSGRVLVAASASSKCHAFDQTRTGQEPLDCPKFGLGTFHRPNVPQDTVNHALFTQAPPGSLVKPLMLAGILSQQGAGSSVVGIDEALQRSDSQRFLDAFFCRQRLGSGDFQSNCQRPKKTLDAAHSLGWNLGCNSKDERSLSQCGKLDLLYGVPLSDKPETLDDRFLAAGFYQPINWPTLTGQFLVTPLQNFDGGNLMADMLLDQKNLNPEALSRCSQSGKTGYSHCKDRDMDLISEAYGQGNARTTPVGVAAIMAALASSMQNMPQRYPHLLEGLWLSDGNLAPISLRPTGQGISLGPSGLPPEISQRIIAAMEKTHTKGGTAFSACAKVMGSSACQTSLGIAGKTGTPGDVDERSLAQLQDNYISLGQCISSKKLKCQELYPLPRPRYRWYAALFKSDATGRYDKAITVLVHSNWRRSDGRFADENSAAAELAMRFIKAAREFPPLSASVVNKSSEKSP